MRRHHPVPAALPVRRKPAWGARSRGDDRRRLSQRLNWLEFVVGIDGSRVFPHRGDKAVVNDASRVRPFRIEWATSESGLSRLFLIVGNLSRSQCGVHRNNNRSLQGKVKKRIACPAPLVCRGAHSLHVLRRAASTGLEWTNQGLCGGSSRSSSACDNRNSADASFSVMTTNERLSPGPNWAARERSARIIVASFVYPPVV